MSKKEANGNDLFFQYCGTFAEDADLITNIVSVIKEKKGIDITDINDTNIYLISVSQKLMVWLANRTRCMRVLKPVYLFGVPVDQIYTHRDCRRIIIKPSPSSSSTTVRIFTKKANPNKADFEELARMDLLKHAAKKPETNFCLVLDISYKIAFRDIIRTRTKDGTVSGNPEKIYDTIYSNVKIVFKADYWMHGYTIYESTQPYCYDISGK